ncbi:uncharacterized protein [Spinacia oleracea]|uniref:Glycosyl transferase family 28 C-terminal domain-containing protein n=1 Tax=Spinacia oleracea TaxID=3562 RepID=A0ABM3QH64_SPIOL|nr:uncharacterized protein LOC130459376 [Spinacia oleracea]
MNIALFNIYFQMLEQRPNLHIIWETGVESFNEMESLVRNHPRLVLAPFLRSMDMGYGAADLIVSRAGSMTCTELLVTGKPAILVYTTGMRLMLVRKLMWFVSNGLSFLPESIYYWPERV